MHNVRAMVGVVLLRRSTQVNDLKRLHRGHHRHLGQLAPDFVFPKQCLRSAQVRPTFYTTLTRAIRVQFVANPGRVEHPPLTGPHPHPN